MTPLVKLVRLNGLQFNRNRDPQVYRRAPNEPFRVEAVLGGTGTARCTLTDGGGAVIARSDVAAPGTFVHSVSFDAPGTRMVLLEVERGAERFVLDLRLDVVAAEHQH